MNHMPCKIDKCILYPSCLNKISVDCQYIRDYYEYLKKEKRIQGSSLWEIFNETLPNMKTIRGHVVVVPGGRSRFKTTSDRYEELDSIVINQGYDYD